MSIKASLNKKLLLFLGDTIFFFSSLCLALFIRRYDIFDIQYFFDHLPRFFWLYVYFLLAMFISGLYDVPQFSLKIKRIKYITYIVFSYIAFGITFFYLLPSQYSPKTVLLIQSGLLAIFIIIWRFYSDTLIKTSKKVKALFIGKTVESEELVAELCKHDYGIDVLHVVDFDNIDTNINKSDHIVSLIERSGVNMVIADIKNEKLSSSIDYIYKLTGLGIRLYDIKIIYQYVFKKMPLSGVGYYWFYEHVALDTKAYEIVKRAMDIVLCIPVFVVLAILHPWVYFKIKEEDGGEVYSVQERLGRHNKTIFIKKYRTMNFTDKGKWLENSENKVTNIGSFLRKTRIDELPQIFAVLRGDLSFIGPRTDMVNLGAELAREIPYYNLRYSVTPGLSGWAQTNMTFQPRTVEDSIERLKYDLYYVKNRSIFLDIITILKTVRTMIAREGS